MHYLIESYNKTSNYFVCKDTDGNSHNLDLLTDATFPEIDKALSGVNCDEAADEFTNSLVGRSIEIERTFPWISFAHGVKFV